MRWIAKRCVLGVAALAAGAGLRANDAWQQPEHLRGSNVRAFSSDGTLPGVSKGPLAKPNVKVADKPKREAELSPPAVQPVSHVSPMQRLPNLPWPKMPHGYQDPTHPVGPAEPGSAAPVRVGPVSSGHVLWKRR